MTNAVFFLFQRRKQSVAHSGFGLKIFGLRGVVFEFLPQVAHVNAQIMTILNIGGTPDFVQQLPLSYYPAQIADQCRKQLELDGGQVYLFDSSKNQAFWQIDYDVTESVYPIAAAPAGKEPAPQLCPDARQKLGNAKWLGQIVVGPGIQAFYFLMFVASGGQDNDRNRAPGPYLSYYLDPIHIGQPQIKNDRIGVCVCRFQSGPVHRFPIHKHGIPLSQERS
jgi:hypothetical protein